MAKQLRFFLLTSLALTVALQSEIDGRFRGGEAGPRGLEGYAAYGPPRYPEFYPRPDYMYNFPPPAYYPPYPIDRRLSDMEPAPKEAADKQPKNSWWDKPIAAPAAKPEPQPAEPASRPRNLEVTPTATAPKKAQRKLRDLSAQQRALANLMKPYFQYLRAHRSASIEEFHSAFSLQFRNDNGFFESNFWPIIQSNYDPSRTPHIRLRKVESQIAQRIFKVDLTVAPVAILKQATPPRTQPKLIPENQLGQMVQQLSLEQARSRDSSDSLSGFQLRPDFQEKYRLLHALYLAENRLFSHPSSKQTILASLEVFHIKTEQQFRDAVHSTLDYFSSVVSQFKVHKKAVANHGFAKVIESVRFMVKSIRNKTLGAFFLKYIRVYASMRIRGNNPTQHQRQSLNLAIGRLISEVGVQSYLTTVYRIIHETKAFRRMRPADPQQTPPAYPIFQQLFQNQIHSGSLRFLLGHYFQSVNDKVTGIENLIFMDDPRLLTAVRFDFRRLFVEFVHDFGLRSFKEFNAVLTTVSGQIDTVLRRAPSTPTKSYFSQFIAVYSKIAFQTLGRYFHLVKQAELFAVYAQTHEIPREFYPENYSAMVHGIRDPHHVGSAVAAVAKAGGNKAAGKSPDADVQRIIFDLSQYLDNPNGVIFNSEAERQSVLNVINSILKKAKSSVLSQKSYMMVNRLRDEINRMNPAASAQPIATSRAPAVDLASELERFRLRLKGIRPVNSPSQATFKISIKFFEDSAVVTKFLITLFQLSTQAENGILAAITVPFLESHTISPEIDRELDRLYGASRAYTDHYEALFSLGETDKARRLWKILMRFYSRECHLELYKQLTMRIAMLAADPEFQADRFNRVKKIVVNMMLFLSKNQNFDLKKDCEQASLLITRKRLVNDMILKRTFLLNSFKKIFLHVGRGGDVPPGSGEGPTSEAGRLSHTGVEHGKKSSRVRQYRDFASEWFPDLGAGGKRVGPPTSKDPKIPPEEQEQIELPPDEPVPNDERYSFEEESEETYEEDGHHLDPPNDHRVPKISLPPIKIRDDKPPIESPVRIRPHDPPTTEHRTDLPPGMLDPPTGSFSQTIKRISRSKFGNSPPDTSENLIREREPPSQDDRPGFERIVDREPGTHEVIREPGEKEIVYVDRFHPAKPFVKVTRTPANKYGAIVLLQAYLGMYGSPVAFPPGFDWEKAVNILNDGDWDFLLKLLERYGKDVRNVGQEKSVDTILKLREIIAKINPPKPVSPPEEAKKDCPPGETKPEDREQTVRFAASMMDAFYQSFARKNDVQTAHKRIKFKVSPTLLNYFAKLSVQHPDEEPAQLLARHPRVYSKIQKSIFSIGKPKLERPPEEELPPGTKPPGDLPPGETKDPTPDPEYSQFAQKVLLGYFRDRLRHGNENPQMLAKKLFKNPSPELRNYLKVLYTKPDCVTKKPVIDPPKVKEITEILKHDEFKFFNRVIKHFYKTTDYLKFSPDAKKINARIFFKYLPSTRRQFVHRVYNRFGAAPKFIKLGPVARVHDLIQRVQFKYQAKCKSSCKSQCYKIVGGKQIELTDEEKKAWGINFSCSQMTDQLKLFDTNGNMVPSAEMALYGCGCQCGGGRGGVQINEKPTLNFNINFENDAEARDFEEFLKNSDFLTKIKDSSVIDLEKLKRKYQVSKLRGVYDLDMVHKSYTGGKYDGDNFDTSGTGDPSQQFQNIDYNTPGTIGLPKFDDYGRIIQPGKKYVLGGQEVNPADGRLKIPFMFGVSPGGEITKLRKFANGMEFDEELNQRGDTRPGQELVLSQRRGAPAVVLSDANYPVYYHLNDGVVGEQLSPEETIRSQKLQETLKVRYPLTAQNYPYKGSTTPFNFGKAPGLYGAGQAGRRQNLI